MSPDHTQYIEELLAEAEQIPKELTADTRGFGARMDAKFSEVNNEMQGFGDELGKLTQWLAEDTEV